MSTLVVIESPYAGDVERNVRYLRDAMRDSFGRGEYPFASHGLYPGALDDLDPEQRAQGIKAGLAWAEHALCAVFYVDLGISQGMLEAYEWWQAEGKPIRLRSLPEWRGSTKAATRAAWEGRFSEPLPNVSTLAGDPSKDAAEKPAPGAWGDDGDADFARYWRHDCTAAYVDDGASGGKFYWWAYLPNGVRLANGPAPTREQAMYEADQALLGAGYPVPDAAPEPADVVEPVDYDVGPWEWDGRDSMGRDPKASLFSARAWENGRWSVLDNHQIAAAGAATSLKHARKACDDHLRGRGLTLDPGGDQ